MRENGAFHEYGKQTQRARIYAAIYDFAGFDQFCIVFLVPRGNVARHFPNAKNNAVYTRK